MLLFTATKHSSSGGQSVRKYSYTEWITFVMDMGLVHAQVI